MPRLVPSSAQLQPAALIDRIKEKKMNATTSTEPSGYQVKFRLQTFTVCDPNATVKGKTWRAGNPISSAADVFNFARGIYGTLDADKEHFCLLALNNKNRVIGYKVISTGTLTQSVVHPREVFRAALAFDAAAIAIFHNHPSGDPAPSAEDIDITKRLKDGAELLGLRLLDHVVVGDDRYFSFNNKGMV
jgi:DNA repair protein RadC